MTDKEVLQKAIEIAIENGYLKGYIGDWNILPRSDGSLQFENFGTITQSIERVIFSHDFAKAFWLEDNRLPILKRPYTPNFNRDFEYHLMMMVLESNPIDYLRKFIVQETKK